jgi:hypothetical protein
MDYHIHRFLNRELLREVLDKAVKKFLFGCETGGRTSSCVKFHEARGEFQA